ncbi:MAG TPA: hypothetical protein PKD70_13785 [Saprospiraceae bacterium]|nr:hypothetical protein [Saprospiraceae bacterium]HMP14943.1 hypothetical protein [Saprospiraceae bacterium]
MKKYMPLLIGLLVLIASSAWSQSSAVEYFQAIKTISDAVVTKNVELLQYAVHKDNPMEIETKRLEVFQAIVKGQQEAKSMKVLPTDPGLLRELNMIMDLYIESIQRDFTQLLELKLESDNSYEAMQRYLDSQSALEKKMQEANERFEKAQEAFAKAHQITLLENAQNKEIETLNRMQRYQRVVFLKFFKVSKLNADFLNLLDANDPAALEKARRELLGVGQSELKSLRAMPDFNGYGGYRDAAVQFVDFFREMAEKEYANMTDIVRRGAQTQQDVDNYNNGIQKYNETASRLHNELNNALQELRQRNVSRPDDMIKKI